MNFLKTLIVICILFTGACVYTVPLDTVDSIPIDKSVLGVWQWVDEDSETKRAVTLTVLRLTDTEYFIQHSDDESSLYFRAYLVEIANHVVLQTEFIGSDEGPIGAHNEEIFNFFKFKIDGGELVVAELNTRLIDKKLSSTKSLREAFIKEKDNPELFVSDDDRFKRIKP